MAVQAPVDDRSRAEADHRAISAAFDPDFYLSVYADLPAGMDPLWHYRMAGWREPRDPAPWFSTSDYLRENPDVAAKIREGKHAAAGALIGAVMKEMRGQADAARVRELILEKLA